MNGKKARWSGNKSRLLFGLITLLFLAISMARGLRVPNLWSATQIAWSYDFGFVRRGLVGTLLEWVKLPIGDYTVFYYFSIWGWYRLSVEVTPFFEGCHLLFG